MSAETDLLHGVASLLDAAGVATYRPDTPYLAGETAIVFDRLPASPDACIVLATYGANNDQPEENLGQVRMQVRVRAKTANQVRDLTDAAFAQLHGLTHVDMGVAHVIQCLRISSNPTTFDESNRAERADNYALDINTPATAARPY